MQQAAKQSFIQFDRVLVSIASQTEHLFCHKGAFLKEKPDFLMVQRTM
jgi:hypothetical protein